MDRQQEVIRSSANEALKHARRVGRGKEAGFVLAEGERLIRDGIEAGHQPEVLFCDEASADRYRDLAERFELRSCAAGLLDGIGALKTTPSLAAVFREPPTFELRALVGGDGPALLLGVAGIADPGNLGALLRVAEAAGARGAVVSRGGARPFGAKALRGSMGSLFRVRVAEPPTLREAVEYFHAHQFSQVIASTRGGEPMGTYAFAERTIIWMTSETGDVPEELTSCDRVTIPMGGQVESLNVTVAGALMLYAASGGHSA